MSHENWIIRPAKGSDVNFIYATWLNSYQCDSSIGNSCYRSTFFPSYSRVIDRILSHEDTQTSVACLPDEEDVIIGYCIYQPTTLHYVFIKKDFRNMGVATSLIAPLREKLKSYTHRTRTAAPILNRYFEAEYNPFLLFQQAPRQGDPHYGTESRSPETTLQSKAQDH